MAKLGFHCEVVSNGLEAVEAVGQKAYTAVLMDCHMPEMDGFDATIEIRRREAGDRHTPIIAMTAGARVEDRDRCMAAGMDDYISKPVAPMHVEAALVPWLGSDHEPSAAVEEGQRLDTFQVLDSERLAMLSALEPEEEVGFVARLVDLFLADTPEQLGALEVAVAIGNGPKVAELTHRLKGAASELGATALASVCDELEALVRTDDLRRGSALIALLHAELKRAREAFRTLLPGIAQAGN